MAARCASGVSLYVADVTHVKSHFVCANLRPVSAAGAEGEEGAALGGANQPVALADFRCVEVPEGLEKVRDAYRSSR